MASSLANCGFAVEWKGKAMKAESELPLSPGLEWAHPLVRDWFVRRFLTPTEPQVQGWPYILAG